MKKDPFQSFISWSFGWASIPGSCKFVVFQPYRGWWIGTLIPFIWHPGGSNVANLENSGRESLESLRAESLRAALLAVPGHAAIAPPAMAMTSLSSAPPSLSVTPEIQALWRRDFMYKVGPTSYQLGWNNFMYTGLLDPHFFRGYGWSTFSRLTTQSGGLWMASYHSCL